MTVPSVESVLSMFLTINFVARLLRFFYAWFDKGFLVFLQYFASLSVSIRLQSRIWTCFCKQVLQRFQSLVPSLYLLFLLHQISHIQFCATCAKFTIFLFLLSCTQSPALCFLLQLAFIHAFMPSSINQPFTCSFQGSDAKSKVELTAKTKPEPKPRHMLSQVSALRHCWAEVTLNQASTSVSGGE